MGTKATDAEMIEKKTHKFSFNIVLLNEGGTWVVQCLEYDIAAQGPTLNEAVQAFQRAFVGQVIVDAKHGKEPLSTTPAAPKRYWDQYKAGRAVEDPLEVMVSPDGDPELPPPWMIRGLCNEMRLAG